MANPIPATHRCHACGEWYANAHACPVGMAIRGAAPAAEDPDTDGRPPGGKFVITDRPGRISRETMRVYFERSITDTAVLKSNAPLERAGDGYLDGRTDTLWTGFALGMMAAERLDKARSDGTGASMTPRAQTVRDAMSALGASPQLEPLRNNMWTTVTAGPDSAAIGLLLADDFGPGADGALVLDARTPTGDRLTISLRTDGICDAAWDLDGKRAEHSVIVPAGVHAVLSRLGASQAPQPPEVGVTVAPARSTLPALAGLAGQSESETA